MNKSLIMHYYNGLRKTNPCLAKTRQGRSMIMNEAVLMVKYHCWYGDLFTGILDLH